MLWNTSLRTQAIELGAVREALRPAQIRQALAGLVAAVDYPCRDQPWWFGKKR